MFFEDIFYSSFFCLLLYHTCPLFYYISTTAVVKIDKQDVYSEEVPGAELTLRGNDKDGNAVTFEEGKVDVADDAKLVKGSGESLIWISGSAPTTVELTDGTYVLHEIAAPTGYEVATDITFVIDDGQVVSVDGVASSTEVIVMVDEASPVTTTTTTTTVTETTVTTTVIVTAEVKIDKQDVYSQEVPGAELTLTGKDKDGDTISFTDDVIDLGTDAVLVRGSGDDLSWISGNGPTTVKLTDGTYVLHEVAAPTGYEVATDITFVIEDGNVVSVDGEATSDHTITMVDEAIETTTTTTITSQLNDEVTTTTRGGMIDNDEVDGSTTTTTTETTETTTTTTETTATTEAVTSVTTTAKNTSDGGSKSSGGSSKSTANSPKTGVKGVGTVMAILALAGAGAYVARSRKDDDQ